MDPSLYLEVSKRYGEDVAQEAAIKLLLHPEVQNERHWVMKVSKRMWIEEYRKQRPGLPLLSIPRAPENPERWAEARELILSAPSQLVLDAANGNKPLSNTEKSRRRRGRIRLRSLT